MAQYQKKTGSYEKLKVFAVLAVICFVLVGSLTLYLGVIGFRYIASVTQDVNVAAQVDLLKSKVKDAPVLVQPNCIETVQGLLSLAPLMEKPIAENIENLRTACFEPSATQQEVKSKESVPI